MICRGVVGGRKLGCNFVFFCTVGFAYARIYDPGLAIVAWGKPAVRWVESTS
jgi:hypothetical protein